MIVFTNPIALLLLIPALGAAVYLWWNSHGNLSPGRKNLALGVRLLLLSAVVFGLAGLSVQVTQSRESTVFVADLSASDASSRSAIQESINEALMARPSEDGAGVVSFGRQALVEQPVLPLSSFDGFQSSVDPDYTNLESGLNLANAILPSGYRRRIVVISDGQQNAGDALTSARLLHSLGVRVDVIPARVQGGPEVLVDRVDVPSQLRPSERFSVTVTVRATVDTISGLDIYRDHTLVLSRQEPIHVGENRFTFVESPLRPGFHTYQVHITPAVDTQPENNTGSASISVQGAPRVLIIAAVPAEARNVVASLKSTGIPADLRRPEQVVPTLGYLQRYAATVIVDTAADVLGPDLLDQLVPYVRDLGHGLVVIGGQESYGMGSYGETPLEQVLPVRIQLPKRKDLPSAAVVLIIENLESDAQVNISKEAGKGVIKLLTQQDQVAVNDTPFDNSSGWAVPLQHATNKQAIDSAIDQMQPGDPVSYAPYLESAYQVLRHANAEVKHIIVLGDGDATDNYEGLLRKIRGAGITVSTVATNGMGLSDFQTMQDIAHWGGGRYYRADDTASIPRIFLREARTVARSGVIEGKFYPQELSANPMLRDMRSTPPLFGYIATTPKAAGEMVLVSQKLDPVLAGWQYGLGRSVAWTSDAAGLWTRDWLRAPGASHFWANLVSWTLPAVGGGHLFVSAVSAQGEGRITVDTPTSVGASPSVVARIVDPNLRATTLQLQPSAPGRYAGAFEAKSQGAYFVTVEARGAGHGEAGQTALDVPYSAEYRVTGTNMPFLQALARAGGGRIFSRPADAWANNLSPVSDQRLLTDLLWLLALILLPVDIGLRRLVLTRGDLAVIREALRPTQKGQVSAEPLVSPLRGLRWRRAQNEVARDRKQAASSTGSPLAGTTPSGAPKRAEPAGYPVPPQGKPAAPDTTGRNPVAGPVTRERDPDGRPGGDSTTGRLLAAKRRRK